MISEQEENKGVNLHVVEIDWEVKKFHTNFHEVLERGGGGGWGGCKQNVETFFREQIEL